MWKNIYTFFDKLEDRIRGKLSRKPILYAFVGGIGVVLFWRGVWHTADTLMLTFLSPGFVGVFEFPWWDGPASVFIGASFLLLSGIFVTDFIGNEIILSGLRGEKKIVDKTEAEVRKEIQSIALLRKEMKQILSNQKLDSKKRFGKKSVSRKK